MARPFILGANNMRLNRTVSKGKVHYVVQRGHNGSDIFFDDKDRETYLTVVFQGVVRHKAVIHAFQLLQHEAHWLFTPHEENSIALTVQSVGREYVRYFNQRWGRTGTLWDGRYKSYWMDKNPFLELNAQKYLDQLSKTSGLTNNEIEWGWSTCAHYCGVFSGTNHIINKEKFRNFISPIPSYWEIGNTPFERQFKYRKFLSEPQSQMVVKEITRCMNRGLPWLKSDSKFP